MSAKDVYRPSESELKCPETLVNKQKTARPALRDQEAAGSNPVTPMRKTAKTLSFGGLLIIAFSGLTTGSTIDRPAFGETVFLFCSVRLPSVRRRFLGKYDRSTFSTERRIPKTTRFYGSWVENQCGSAYSVGKKEGAFRDGSGRNRSL